MTPIYSMRGETRSRESSYLTSMGDTYSRHLNLLSRHISNSHCGNTCSSNFRVTNNGFQIDVYVLSVLPICLMVFHATS